MEGRRLLATVLTVGAVMTTAFTVGDDADRTVDAAPVEESRLAQGPLGGISIIGDSVMLGSLVVDTDLPDRLVEQGWGPVRARAGEGYSTGYFDVPIQFKASFWIEQWRSAGWDPEAVIVNFGANDSGFCGADTICAEAAIRHLVDTIGPRRIFWPKITRFPFHRTTQDAWNDALDRVAATTPGFATWDWPTVMYEIGLYSPTDHIHQTAAGYRARSQRMAVEATLALSDARQVGGPVPLPAAGDPSELVPIEPVRVLDTRDADAGRVAAEALVTVPLAEHVPEGATAVGLYVTAVDPAGDGHLSVAPCPDNDGSTSMLNYTARANRGASTIVPLGDDDTVCVYSWAETDIVVDLQTVFVPTGASPDSLRFTPTAPQRLIDTRDTGRSRRIEVTVPGDARVAAVNVTVTGSTEPGHVTAHPCLDEPPLTAMLNHGAGETIASFAFVTASDDGTICFDTFTETDLVVDLSGVGSADGELRFVAAEPTRTIDTRDGTGGWGFRHGSGQTIPGVVAPPDAEAVTGTVTLVQPYAASFLQTFGCGPVPPTSAVNAAAGAVYANATTVGIEEGRLCIRAYAGGGTVFDTTGWWVP